MAVRFTTTLSIDGLRVESNIPRGCSAWQKANSVFNPLGPSPTKAWLAVPKQSFDQVVANSNLGSTHTLNWVQQITNLSSGSVTETKTLSFKGLYFVGGERILHGGTNDSNSLFLLELADARYVVSRKGDSGSLIANARSYANNSDYLTGTSGYTWNSLVQTLWDACGLLGTYPSLPGSLPIDGVPQNHWLIGLNAYRCLCVVLDYLDCAIAHNPFGTVGSQYSIVQLGASQTLASNTDTLKWNSEPSKGVSSHVAANLKVYFHYHRKGYGQERDAELANNWAYNGAGTTITVASGVAGAVGTLPLWDDLPAILDETGNQTNAAACTTRANNRKSRYATRYSVASQHRIHTGLFASDYLPGGTLRAVLWRNWYDGMNQDGSTNPFGGTCTEFICSRELVHGFKVDTNSCNPVVWLDSNNDSPEWQQYSGLDLGKHSYPVYPRLPNIVQVWHTGPTEGENVYPVGQYGLHKGRVRRWVNNELAVLDDCWILFVDDYDTNLGNIPAKQGDCFGPGRLSGITTDLDETGTLTLPVYTVRKGSSTTNAQGEIVVFALTSALGKGTTATATANLCILQGGVWVADPTQVITVTCGYSSVGRLWTGSIGTKGLAYQRLDGTYEIIYMTRNDMFIPFTATEVREESSDSFAAEVLYGFQHGDISPDTFRVYDEYQLFPRVVTGAIGISVWDDEEGRYQVVFVQQEAITAKAQISNATEGLKFGDIDYISITNFIPTSPSPFNLTPSPVPTLAYNQFGLRGKDADWVWLEWDNEAEDWIVVQVANNEKSYVVKPVNTIAKGGTGNCEIYVNRAATGRFVQCVAEGAQVTANKWCSAWTEPSTGIVFVAPWECS